MAGEMDNLSGYDPEASRLLLAEAVRVVRRLGFASQHVAIVGGLVPLLLVPEPAHGVEAHVGTRDLDLCLSMAIIEGRVGSYEKIEDSLRAAGYTMVRDEEGTPQTWRWRGDGDVPIVVEFLCPAGPTRAPGQLHNPRGQVAAACRPLLSRMATSLAPTPKSAGRSWTCLETGDVWRPGSR